MAKVIEFNKVTTEVEEGKKQGFWTDKVACWEKSNCPEMIKAECPAVKYQFLPCWEIEGTYCKLDDYGTDGKDTSICEICRVYKTYGEGKPIQLKLMGRGINTSLKSVEQAVKS